MSATTDTTPNDAVDEGDEVSDNVVSTLDNLDEGYDGLHSYEVFPVYQRASWVLDDIDWDEFRADKVTDEHIAFAKGAIVGESNSVAAQHGFFNEFHDDYDFSAFVALWGYQELQHHLCFKKWLRLAGDDVDYYRINAMRAPYPPGITPAATLATNIISEWVTNHMYRAVAKTCEEPLITRLMKRAGGDEARHAREFTYYTKRRVTQYPKELASVLETFYVYMADPDAPYEHPVERFKGHLPELQGHEGINEVFEAFDRVDDPDRTEHKKLTKQLYKTLSAIVGKEITKASHVRRALAEATSA